MQRNQDLAGPLIMLLSAAIFGFFGFFYIDWNSPGVDGRPVLFRLLMGWTLRLSAVLFAAGAGLTLIRPVWGNLVYALTGIVAAGLFIVVAVMDVADTRHGLMPYGPVILLLFAAWNGYGSWASLRAVVSMRAERSGAGPGA